MIPKENDAKNKKRKYIREMEEKKENVSTKLGDRMKAYEKKEEILLDANLPVVVRVDGHSFSKFTKGLSLPFDHLFALVSFKT